MDIDLTPNGRVNLKGSHDNIRTKDALQSIVDNLDYIPIDEIENFVNTHKKI